MKGKKKMKTTNLANVLGAPINTIIHVFEKKFIWNDGKPYMTRCSVEVTYYRKANLCKVVFNQIKHSPSARMMYVPTDQLGMVITSMTDAKWRKVYTTHVCHDVDGCYSIPMDDMIGLIHDAEHHINSLSPINVTPEERVCIYLESRKFN